MALKTIPDDVIQMVAEHHEDCSGQGYPLGKNKFTLHPLSKIIQVANLFIDQALKSPTNPGMVGLAAIEHMNRAYGDRLDKKTMAALQRLFPA